MTPEKKERAIKWLTEEVRSLRMAPKINGCGPENWADQLEIMETCLEAVRGHENKPLTKKEMMEMDGDPAWCDDEGGKCWGLIYIEPCGQDRELVPFFMHQRDHMRMKFDARDMKLYRYATENGTKVAVGCNDVANGLQSGARSVMESEVMNRPFVRDITKVCECCCTEEDHPVDTNKMVPLNLEQLRGMRGKWVWLITNEEEKAEGWAFVSEDEVSTFFGASSDKYAIKAVFRFDEVGKEFFAYVHPPVATDTNVGGKDNNVFTKIDKEACETCKICECERIIFRATSVINSPAGMTDMGGPARFCPLCGRPLTPEAWAELEKRLMG